MNYEQRNHLDLFSGIGGFALAAEKVWPGITHTFVEYEPFCQAVLKKHWPEAEIHGDIREFIADSRGKKSHGVSGEWGQKVAEVGNCYLLTGGFPCQPFSTTGRRKGTEDDRYLWPEMLECIRIFRPRWVIAENVRGLVTWNDGMVLKTVCSDLEREGYEVWPLIIPAASVGAPHRRERIWIVAHASGTRRREISRGSSGDEISHEGRFEEDNHVTSSEGADAPNAASFNVRRWGRQPAGHDREPDRKGPHERWPDWNEDWTAVATRLCTLDDGLPNGLVRPRGWRNAALKAAGNAIVPQVAIAIMFAIQEAEITSTL